MMASCPYPSSPSRAGRDAIKHAHIGAGLMMLFQMVLGRGRYRTLLPSIETGTSLSNLGLSRWLPIIQPPAPTIRHVQILILTFTGSMLIPDLHPVRSARSGGGGV